MPSERSTVRVVVFSGGRGSSELVKGLVRHPAVTLTIAINGYDDGLSTGEVRRFLGDSLGPSDFRKNASRVARALGTAPSSLLGLIDARLPVGCSPPEAERLFDAIRQGEASVEGEAARGIAQLAAGVEAAARERLCRPFDAFMAEVRASGRLFDFSDCSLGNILFGGIYLESGRRFNRAVDDYCAVVGLPPGLIDNVTDGTNAHLVALTPEGRILASEAEIVDATRHNRIADIFLLPAPLAAAARDRIEGLPADERAGALAAASQPVTLNPRLAGRLAEADLIIYAPGTQHSSLFPSYLTPGLSAVIAGNLRAFKLLVTNIQVDAEIEGSSAVDIIERAVYYLHEKGAQTTPTPCLITHYLINDPARKAGDAPYVPLGRLDNLEDPRLVRIADYEEGVTGHHDASRAVLPFIDSFLSRTSRSRVAVWLYDESSTNTLIQTVLEMVRGGIERLPLDLTVFHETETPLSPAVLDDLPFEFVQLARTGTAGAAVRSAIRDGRYDYVVLFETSGMYNGEDLVGLCSRLPFGRLDAIWGSRRLSVRDVQESLRVRYRHRTWLHKAAQAGSHALSLAYLLLYGRYVSDTLSGARAVRTRYVLAAGCDAAAKLTNQRLLSFLLADRAELLETPVQFFSIAPGRARRTRIREGLRSLAMIVWWRIRPPAPAGGFASSQADARDAATKPGLRP